MMKTIFAWAVLGLILLSGIWYFFLKESAYSISFRTSRGPGEIYQTLLYYPFDNKFDNSKITKKIPYKRLVQEVEMDGEKLELGWNFSEEKDSESLVKIYINYEDSFQNRLSLLFRKNIVNTKVIDEIREIKNNLEKDSNLYRIKIIGQEISPSTTCACISLKNEVNQKAVGMIRNISSLSDYFMESELKMTGKPRNVINSWDIKTNFINYDFCFPLAEESLTLAPSGITIKSFPPVKSIKAIYNGNYMYSHFAWIKILNYAEKNNLEVENTPLEIFNDNPEMGGDASGWEAEIYMPLK